MANTHTAADVAAFEHATWSRCAPGYEVGFARLTSQALTPLLESAAVASGDRVLDIGTGTGGVAAAALERGASVVGVDFSEAMISEARRLVPQTEFRVANAEALPFDDGSFDAVIANCVLHHLAEPDQSLQEARRVLDRNGRIACTIWTEPESLEAFGLFFAAVEQLAGSAELPHGPMFGVTDEGILTSLFAGAGFSNVAVERLWTTWRMDSIDELLRALGAWAQLDSFPPDVRMAIEDSVRSAAVAYEKPTGFEIPNPMLLISATKTP